MAAEVESTEEAKIIDFWNGIAAEKVRMRAQYFATCAGHSLKKWLALDCHKRAAKRRRIEAYDKADNPERLEGKELQRKEKAQRRLEKAKKRCAEKIAKYYAEQTGRTHKAWLALDRLTRAADRAKVEEKEKVVLDKERERLRDACEAERERVKKEKKRIREEKRAERERVKKEKKAERERQAELKRARLIAAEARAKHHAKRPAKKTYALPGVTHRSMINGLASSPNNAKWLAFASGGEYWNYIASRIRSSRIFRGREDLVLEATTQACTGVGRHFCEKEFVWPEEGKGYFRGFLKSVARNSALTVLRRELRADKKFENRISEAEQERKELAEVEGIMEKNNGRALDERIENSAHDEENPDFREFGGKLSRALGHLDEITTSDPASFFGYTQSVSADDRAWLQKLQIHVFYIALTNMLYGNSTKSAQRREMLRLRFGLGKTPKEIHGLPDFRTLSENAFSQKMKNAVDDMRREVKVLWSMVAPDKHDFADERIMRLWRSILEVPARRKLGKALKGLAEEWAGRLDDA